MKKLFVLILVVCILACAMIGCDSGAATSGNGYNDALTQSDQDTTSANTDPNSGFSIPGTLVAENFDITIVSAEICNTVALNSGIEIEVEPDEGKQFLVLCIDAKNTSDDVMNLGSFLTYVDNITVLPHNMLGKYDDRILFSGSVNPGKIMCTYIMYQVPTSWETFELSYLDALTGSMSDAITICKSDIS